MSVVNGQQPVSMVNGQQVTVNNRIRSRVLVTPLGTTSRQVFPTTLQQQVRRESPLLVTQALSGRLPSSQQLRTPQAQGVPNPAPLSRVLVKAVSKGGNLKDAGKTFSIRNVDTVAISTCDNLKSIIREQLSEDIIPEYFDVGFVDGTSVVRIRNKEDLHEVWAGLRKPGSKMLLWCDGLLDKSLHTKKRDSHKRSRSDDVGSDSDGRPPKKKQQEREEKVQDIVDDLKEKHGSGYTPMQMRIWAEMVASGMHPSIDDPPSTTMFARAGGITPSRKKEQRSPVAQALTDAATALASALSPKGSTVSGVGSSPVKVIEGRSKLYKQLADLQNLRNSGILTEDEYKAEKESIMSLLQQLKAK